MIESHKIKAPHAISVQDLVPRLGVGLSAEAVAYGLDIMERKDPNLPKIHGKLVVEVDRSISPQTKANHE